MRKRIECRVIESVPLDNSRDSAQDVTRSAKLASKSNGRAAFTYTPRLIATPTCLDDDFRRSILNLYA